MKTTTTQWAWGPSAHWKLYFSLKNFSKKFYYHVSSNIESSISRSSGRRQGERTSSRLYNAIPRRKASIFQSRCFSGTSTCSINSRGEIYLSNEQVNQAIRQHENVILFDNDMKKLRCETNQLPSNHPNEDQLFVTRSNIKGDVLVGVIDGHGGNTLGKVIKSRLPYYLHSSLCDKSLFLKNSLAPMHLVENMLNEGDNLSDINVNWEGKLNAYMNELIRNADINNNDDTGRMRLSSYINSFKQFYGNPDVTNSYETSYDEGISEAIRAAFLRLDNDLISEVRMLSEMDQLDTNNLGLALSGCCALVAYIVENELFVANSGDCRAILGSNSNGLWSSVQLTYDHTSASNSDEVQRILSEHPREEARTCLQYGRLLGRLAPLRAFGDIQFKLTAEELQRIFKVLPNYKVLPGLKTPPYLTAEPDVFHYRLEKSDKFIVLASDGLWDMLSNDEVVELVAAYMEGTKIDMLKERAHLFGVANCEEIMADPDAFMDSANENVASFLIRFALGGYDQESLRSMLALPYPDVRLYRDDITVLVIFLDRYFEDV